MGRTIVSYIKKHFISVRGLLVALTATTALSLSGCANLPAPVNYSPSSSLTANGSVTVSDFKYLPAMDGKIAPNQLKNTALGSIKLDKNIDVFYRDAVFKELRFVGVKVDDPNRKLTGEIKEFLVDDLGYSVDWTVDVHYQVTDTKTGAVLYEGEKVTKNKTAKFVNVFEALNQQIRSNIEDLIKDQAFIKAIN